MTTTMTATIWGREGRRGGEKCNEAKNINDNIILRLPPQNTNQLMMVTQENATGKQG